MFTGLIEETGIIKGITKRHGSIIFTIQSKKTLKGLAVDHSIAIDGVCLTVIHRERYTFDVQAVEETLTKTALGNLHLESPVNLERSLLPTDRVGGHFVLGHVDGLGKVTAVEKRRSSWMFWIKVPNRFMKHLIPVGSVAVNGISLTVAGLRGNEFGVSIIPHTMEVTTFKNLKKGMQVNLEFDVLGKYVEQLLASYRTHSKNR